MCGGHCQDKAPDSSRNEKRQAKHEECDDFGWAIGVNELRQESKKEQRDLRVCNVGEDPLAKRYCTANTARRCRNDSRGLSGHQHTNAEIDQIGGANELQDYKGGRGRSEDGG